MKKKDLKIIDKVIGDLSVDSQRIQKFREVTNINPQFTFTREAEIVEHNFRNVLDLRKKCEGTVISSSTSGWTVNYIRQHKTYKKNEKYSLNIYFTFVETDTYD